MKFRRAEYKSTYSRNIFLREHKEKREESADLRTIYTHTHTHTQARSRSFRTVVAFLRFVRRLVQVGARLSSVHPRIPGIRVSPVP